jgi:hypothetical protein
LTISAAPTYIVFALDGVVAQLVERLNGIQEVRGSNPLGSTIQSVWERLFRAVVIGAIRIQTVLAVIVIVNLIGLTIAAYMILRKK